MHQNIASRMHSVQQAIEVACLKATNRSRPVTLIAVSKLQSQATIEEAYGLGMRHFGENYAQELSQKAAQCPKDIVWHFIGPIQTNKLKLIAESASWVHSVDRAKVAKKLDEACKDLNKEISVLIQVNVDSEASKSGIKPEELIAFASELNTHYSSLKLKGLMFMPNIHASDQDKLKTYARIQQLQHSLLEIFPDCTELSLGTSGDFEEAIAAGSSMVRIGETLMGART
jgi:pyridoxal phosphate enzyme (YggS family)